MREAASPAHVGYQYPPLGADGWASPAGERAIEFIELVCRYTKGPHAGELVELRTWQRTLILELYREQDGVRVIRRGLWGLARKNGKTMLGACLALFELIGAGTTGAEVYSVAGDRDQARICFDEAMRMVRMDPGLNARLKIRDNQATILHLLSGSSYRAIAADAPTAEGYNPSFCVFDEVHVQKNAKLWAVMTNGSATRDKACVLGITTAGYDPDTLCGRLYKMGLAGEVPGFMFRWWEAPSTADWMDERTWYAANPGLGDFQYIEDFRNAINEAAARGAENEYRRYRLNQWTDTVEAWLGHGVWANLARPDLDVLEGGDEPVILGFDGSFDGDSTALILATISDQPHLQTIDAWEKPEGEAGTGWHVPIAEVEARVTEAVKAYHVRELVCDPYRWQQSMETWANDGIPVVEFPTGSLPRIVPATVLFNDLVRDGMLTHDGSEVLARHIRNARLKHDARGMRIVKEAKGSPHKIDAAVAAIIAVARAMHSEPEEPMPEIY